MQSKHKKNIVYSMIINLCFLLFIPVLSLADGYTLSDSNAEFGSLLSSVIFSESKSNKTTAGVTISLDELSKYGTKWSNGSTNTVGGNTKVDSNFLVYGQMPEPMTDRASSEGSQLANYIATLFEYEYLVTYSDLSNNDGVFSRFGNFVKKIGKAFDTIMMTISMWTAYAGAMLFDIGVGIIDFLETGLTKFDVPTLLGLRDIKGAKDGWLNKFIKSMLEMIGITDGVAKAMQNVFYLCITAFFLFTVVWVLSTKGTTGTKKKGFVKNFLMRAMVILTIIPITTLITDIIDDGVDKLTNGGKAPNEFVDSYVLDTVNWASTMNLSLHPINNGGFNSNGFTGADTKYKPTPNNIKKLNDEVNRRSRLAGLQYTESITNANRKTDVKKASQSAKDLMWRVSSKQTVTIDDYTSTLSVIDNYKFSNVSASRNFPAINDPVSLGGGFEKSDQVKNGKFYFPYFLQENPALSDKKGQNDEEEKEGDDDVKPLSSFVIGNKTYYQGGSEPVVASPSSKKKLDTYIYGVAPIEQGSKYKLDFGNYIDNSSSYQKVNPETGKFDYDDEEQENSLKNNALNVAIMNKYGGIEKNGAMSSLSTQSTVFLLQSTYKEKGQIVYKGMNTVKPESSQSANTGAGANRFVRYVIPSSSKNDLNMKIGQLTFTWMASGWTAILVLIFVLQLPVFGALVKMFKSFFSAFLTGNVVAMLEYVAFYTALKLSLSTAKVSVYFGTMVSNTLNNMTGTSFIMATSIGSILIIIVYLLIVTIPVVRMKVGKRQRKLSLLAIMLSVPYMLAEAIEEHLEQWHMALYGKPKGRSFASKLGNKVDGANNMQELGKKTGQVAQAGASLAGGVVGGVTGGPAGAKAGASIGGAIGGVANDMLSGDESPENNMALPDKDGELGGMGGIPMMPNSGSLEGDELGVDDLVGDELAGDELAVDELEAGELDAEGYDKDGYDEEGFNREGLNKDGLSRDDLENNNELFKGYLNDKEKQEHIDSLIKRHDLSDESADMLKALSGSKLDVMDEKTQQAIKELKEALMKDGLSSEEADDVINQAIMKPTGDSIAGNFSQGLPPVNQTKGESLGEIKDKSIAQTLDGKKPKDKRTREERLKEDVVIQTKQLESLMAKREQAINNQMAGFTGDDTSKLQVMDQAINQLEAKRDRSLNDYKREQAIAPAKELVKGHLKDNVLQSSNNDFMKGFKEGLTGKDQSKSNSNSATNSMGNSNDKQMEQLIKSNKDLSDQLFQTSKEAQLNNRNINRNKK